MSIEKYGFVGVVIFYFLNIVLQFALIIGACYVAWHFISKFW